MEPTLAAFAAFEVDGGYLPGGDESSDLAESLTMSEGRFDLGQEPEVAEESLDASIFAAMLHP
jgi:hypothetical protein